MDFFDLAVGAGLPHVLNVHRLKQVVASSWREPKSRHERPVARTVVVEPLGSHVLVTARIEDQLVKVMTGIDAQIKAGDDLWLQPVTSKLRWFDPASGKEIAS